MSSFAWLELLRSSNKFHTNKRILSLDPGHTTGYAVFENGYLRVSGTIPTISGNREIHFKHVYDFLEAADPDIIVMEEYRIYQKFAQSHIDSTIPTMRLIGGIEMYAALNNKRTYFQSASRAKGFCTDIKLQDWSMLTNSNHSNDAIRHGCAFLLFDKREN